MPSRDRKTVLEGLEWIERANRKNEYNTLSYEVENHEVLYVPSPEEHVCIFLIYIACVVIIAFSNINLVHQYLYA